MTEIYKKENMKQLERSRIEEGRCFAFLSAAAAGNTSSLKILIEQGLLKVSAEQDGHKYSSVISAPKKADPKKSSARYEDGMLYLELKKLDSHKSVELTITE